MDSEVSQSAAYYKILAWFEVNKTRLVYAAVAALLVAVVVWFFLWRSDQRKLHAGQALSDVFVPQATGRAVGADPVKGYLEVAAKYPDSRPAAQAVLLAGAALFEQGKFAEAQAQFESFTRENRGSPLIPQAALGIAASLDAQGKTDAAVAAYKDLLDRYPSENFVPQVRYALARLYQDKGDFKLAFQNYQDIQRIDPYGQIGSEAGLRIEELKAKHPELSPPITNAAPPTITLGTNTISFSTNTPAAQ